MEKYLRMSSATVVIGALMVNKGYMPASGIE